MLSMKSYLSKAKSSKLVKDVSFFLGLAGYLGSQRPSQESERRQMQNGPCCLYNT